MTTTGALGRDWRAEVTSAGAIEPWDGSAPLDWAIAADDRWHRPAEERAVRQERVRGTPVVETRVSIPGGDAVQRVWSVADGPGLTLMEIFNDSPLPIAVALTRPDLLTSRPPTDVPIDGIDLPADSVLLPIGHRTRVVAGFAHDGSGAGPLPSLADPDAVVRGWRAFADRAGRLVLPDERIDEIVVAARCELLLAGLEDPSADPVGFLIGVGELQRLGELTNGQAADAALELAVAVESIARRPGWDVDAALDAAARVFHHAGDRRAVRDVNAVIDQRGPAELPDPTADRPDDIRVVPFVERPLAARGALVPGGLPAAWRGAPVEAHDLPVGPDATVSYALRWHGPNLAALWETTGERTPLTSPVLAPSWCTAEVRGETLWVDPPLINASDPIGLADTSFS